MGLAIGAPMGLTMKLPSGLTMGPFTGLAMGLPTGRTQGSFIAPSALPTELSTVAPHLVIGLNGLVPLPMLPAP